VSRIEGSGKRSLRRPKLSTRKFSAWKKKRVEDRHVGQRGYAA
jgi:hypothetical protein